MVFLAPLALILLALAGVVLWLHVQRHKIRTVGSLHLWRRLQPKTASRRPVLSWPRPSWLLLLQLAALTALVLALAQPWWGDSSRRDHKIIILDASASMQTLEGESDRFALAAARANAAVRSLHSDTRLTLIAADSPTRIVLARQRAVPEGIADTIADMAPGDGTADWERVADLALATIRAGEATDVLVLTDGSDAEVDGLRARLADANLEILGFGTPQANVGLTATLTQVPDQTTRWVLNGAALFSGGATSTSIEISLQPDGASSPLVWAQRTVSVPARADLASVTEVPFTFDLDFTGGALVSATLSPDANSHDNVARFVTRAMLPTHDVLYVGDGEQKLIAALRAIAGVALYQAPDLPKDLSQFALVVVDDVAINRRPEVSTLWLGAVRVIGAAAPERSDDSDPLAWNETHTLSQGIDWSALTVSETSLIDHAADAAIILSAARGPLITAQSTQWGHDIRLGFDPADSNWPDQTSFPAFMHNVFNWLGLPQGMVDAGCQVGTTCTLDARVAGGTVSRLTDAGWSAPESWREPLDHLAAGFYRFERNAQATLLAVNPAVRSETDLTQVITLEADAAAAQALALAPWLLGAAIAILLVEAWMAGRGPERFLLRVGYAAHNPHRARHIALLGLRLAVLGLLVMALFHVVLRLPETIDNVVLVADGTAPTIAASGSQRLAVINVGPDGGIVQDLGQRDKSSAGQTPLTTADGLALAAALLPAEQSGRVLLAASGALAQTAPLLPVAVDLLSPVDAGINDVSVEMLQAPATIYAGDRINLVLRVASTRTTSALLVVEAADAAVIEQTVALRSGDNRIELELPPAIEGENHYSIAVTADGDQRAANNRNEIIVNALRPARIAIVAAQADAGAAFAEALGDKGLIAEVMTPQLAPRRLDLLLHYDAIALMNVPAVDLSTHQQSLIQQAVETHGRGLLILGGENSFGPGGYLETALDRLSPISSKVPREAPRAALVFVLDRSGSMIQAVGNSTRLDIAKAATLSAIKLLNEQSQVGIVVFDSEARVLVPLQPVDQPAAIQALKQLDAGGGTAIYPGLSMAFEQLRGVDEPTRHVVVMTDGLSTPGDFPSVLAAMRAAGITVSTVAIGEGADSNELRSIAASGGGVYHATRDFEALPSILSQEAMQLSGAPIEEHSSAPYWRDRRAAFLAGLPTQMPPVHGYVLTTAKPEAKLHLALTDSEGAEMPLLASWQFGNGQVLALTTTAQGAGPGTGSACLNTGCYGRKSCANSCPTPPPNHCSLRCSAWMTGWRLPCTPRTPAARRCGIAALWPMSSSPTAPQGRCDWPRLALAATGPACPP